MLCCAPFSVLPVAQKQHADCVVQMICICLLGQAWTVIIMLATEAILQVFSKWDLNLAQFKAQPVWRQRMQKQTVGLF